MPAGMIFQAHIPVFPLNKFIEVLIYFEQAELSHTVDRFLPNGDTEVLIDFHDTPQFIYDNNSLKEIQACNHVWASGVRTEPITIPSGNGATMMVISFKKGMAASFFPFPMDEIADSVVDADLIWGSEFGDLRERLVEERDIGRRFAMLEGFLLRMFGARLDINPCVEFAVNEMTRRPDRISIARMNEKIGYSQKHFTEMFRRSVGITPKSYLKIMRFQKAVRTIDAATGIEWDMIAQDCGFYDQAHFINDFKHFSGFTPDQYSKIHTNYQNYVPVG
ncbi:MAG: helix-turn-helix domain-containing protein [Pyrinomonadaceae bacterium]